MPTLPSEPHREHHVSRSFGVDPDRYDRARPRYPDVVLDRIVAAAPGRHLLDVGCGTGIEARQLRGAGCTVLGVEPDERMAAFARRTGLEVEVAPFEDWNAAGRTFDAVVAGTAWHWIDPVAGAVKAAAVLRPGGLLAPVWHIFAPPADVAEAAAEAYLRVVPDSPLRPGVARPGVPGYQPLLTRAADGMRASGAFAEPDQWHVEWDHAYSRDEWLEQMLTTGGMTSLRPEQRDEVLAGVEAAVGDTVTVHISTVAVTARRQT
ncbi:class I SAM-dependent methyltransferase [Couchioplanes caeruleus]|uniref:class I SAM-dependent methyltransferase n=1 Tax=Couchioplanes caeruleus TaxID=56438 RepID=UPI0020C08E4B|nr:class I SAM-dependent methyltransferase [Couchioplanes caeruleus]UQU67320.1 class I SAM-dependent methyltransferase [Couchioplanes caeruleus]